MYIPNLFGAYIEGREKAINANWNDLKNYELVEAQRNQNDLQALEIVRQRAKFGGEMGTFYNDVDESHRANHVSDVMMPGRLATAQRGSAFAQDQWGAYQQNRPQIQAMLGETLGTNVQTKRIANDTQQFTNNELIKRNAPQVIGTYNADNAMNVARANHITNSNAPNVANQTVEQSNLNHLFNRASTNLGIKQAENSVALLPAEVELRKATIQANLDELKNAPLVQDQISKEKFELRKGRAWDTYRSASELAALNPNDTTALAMMNEAKAQLEMMGVRTGDAMTQPIPQQPMASQPATSQPAVNTPPAVTKPPSQTPTMINPYWNDGDEVFLTSAQPAPTQSAGVGFGATIPMLVNEVGMPVYTAYNLYNRLNTPENRAMVANFFSPPQPPQPAPQYLEQPYLRQEQMMHHQPLPSYPTPHTGVPMQNVAPYQMPYHGTPYRDLPPHWSYQPPLGPVHRPMFNYNVGG